MKTGGTPINISTKDVKQSWQTGSEIDENLWRKPGLCSQRHVWLMNWRK